MESQQSAQEQLDQLDTHREALRERAAYPFWYWAAWSLACSWMGIIAVVPETPRFWLYFGQWIAFAVLIVAHSRRRVRVPRPPLTWPSRIEWLVLIAFLATMVGLMVIAARNDQPWIISAAAMVNAVGLAVFAHRTQRVVFKDER